MSYCFHPAAEAEYLDAIAYYESKPPGLGAGFVAEFEAAIAGVCSAPHRNPVERPPDIRRKQLKRVPYTPLYREGLTSIEVLAVAHHRRRPQHLLSRL